MEQNGLTLGSYISLNDKIYEVVGQTVTKESKKIVIKDLDSDERLEKDSDDCSNCTLLEIISKEMQFSYEDGKQYYFMDIETYQQMPLTYDKVKDIMPYIIEDSIVIMSFVQNRVVAITPPTEVVLTVQDAEDLIVAGYKNVTLETGLVIQVPYNVNVGDKIVINTQKRQFVKIISIEE